jgi:hypothetical protein
MRHAPSFHPEWGYLAPRPGFIRTARLVIVASAVGAAAGAAVVISLVDRPPAEGSVAARTLVQQPVAASASVSVPASAQPQTDLQREQSRVATSNSGLEQNMPPPTNAGAEHLAASDSATASAASRPTGAATLAEMPFVADESATVPPNPVLAPKVVTKKPRLAYRASPRYGAPRYDGLRYGAPAYGQYARGPFAYLRQFGSQEY